MSIDAVIRSTGLIKCNSVNPKVAENVEAMLYIERDQIMAQAHIHKMVSTTVVIAKVLYNEDISTIPLTEIISELKNGRRVIYFGCNDDMSEKVFSISRRIIPKNG